jgi:hypothetical protein
MVPTIYISSLTFVMLHRKYMSCGSTMRTVPTHVVAIALRRDTADVTAYAKEENSKDRKTRNGKSSSRVDQSP